MKQQKKANKQIALSITFIAMFLFVQLFAQHNFVNAVSSKVTICHATSSATNPWVRTVVSENATSGHFENDGTPLSGHEDDVLLQGDVACPDATVTPTQTPTSTQTPTTAPTATPTIVPTTAPTATPTIVPCGECCNECEIPTPTPTVIVEPTPTVADCEGYYCQCDGNCGNIYLTPTPTVVVEPTVTPTVTPTNPTPTNPTPTTFHPSATPSPFHATPTPGAAIGGAVLGISTESTAQATTKSRGKVLGISTLAKTGTFGQTAGQLLILLGIILVGAGLKNVYSHQKAS